MGVRSDFIPEKNAYGGTLTGTKIFGFIVYLIELNVHNSLDRKRF